MINLNVSIILTFNFTKVYKVLLHAERALVNAAKKPFLNGKIDIINIIFIK